MPNFYINSYQVNDDYFDVVITSTNITPNFGLATHAIPRQVRPVHYFTSGQGEDYEIEFTIYRTSGTWSQLKLKQKQIADILNSQVTSGVPLLFRLEELGGEDPCPIYLDHNAVYVYVDSPDLPTVGTDGRGLLNIKMSGKVLGAPVSDGGVITLTDYYTVESL